jgi:hypothetical protein
MSNVLSRSYTLRTETGMWLAQVVLTSDGMFASVTDYGNLSYAWRSTGVEDFRKFILELNTDYFATKLFTGMSYIVHTKAVDKACQRFSEIILPALQAKLKEDFDNGIGWTD